MVASFHNNSHLAGCVDARAVRGMSVCSTVKDGTVERQPEVIVGPPRAWVLAADWGNTIAGILLMSAFLLGALMFNAGSVDITLSNITLLQRLFCAEGFFYAFAEFFMIGIMANTPPEFGGGDRGCMQFAILMAGGIFFSFSGLVIPQCITNIAYIFDKDPCTHPLAGNTPYVWNAMAHFGITCFMVGTTIGFMGILGAPKNKLVSPFWGVTMYFMGAWTIGIFKFWGPVLLGGFDLNQNAKAFDMTAPAAAYTANWWFALLGAGFLTTGAVIFGIMNGSFASTSPAALPEKRESELSIREDKVPLA